MLDKRRYSNQFARQSSFNLLNKDNQASASQKQNPLSNLSKPQHKDTHDATADITNKYQNLMSYFGNDKIRESTHSKSKYEHQKTSQDNMFRRKDEEERYLGIKKYLNSHGDYLYNHDDVNLYLLKRGLKRGYSISDIYGKQSKSKKYTQTRYNQHLKPFAATDIPLSKTSIRNNMTVYKTKDIEDSFEGTQNDIYGRNQNGNSQIKIDLQEEEDDLKIMKRTFSVDKYGVKHEINPYQFVDRSTFIKNKHTHQDHSNCVYCKNHVAKVDRKRYEMEQMKQYNRQSPSQSITVVQQRQPNYINHNIQPAPQQQIIRPIYQQYVQPVVQPAIIQQAPINYVRVIPQPQQIMQPYLQHYVRQMAQPYYQHLPQQYYHHYPQQYIQPMPQQYMRPMPQQYPYPQQYLTPQQYYAQYNALLANNNLIQPQQQSQPQAQTQQPQLHQQKQPQQQQLHLAGQRSAQNHHQSTKHPIIQQQQSYTSTPQYQNDSQIQFSASKLPLSSLIEKTISQPQFMVMPPINFTKTISAYKLKRASTSKNKQDDFKRILI